jgi:L-amino acid N-acyltransferase YncA
MAILIRTATPADAPAIAAIYDHHARHSTATFDLEGPPASAWSDKIGAITSRGWPFLVAEQRGRVLAYAYATQFRDRPGYAHSCENSIYVAAAEVGKGIGTQLLGALKANAAAAGFEQMVAVIGGAEPASAALHRRHGFEERGRMLEIGTKFGRRLDTLYMQCSLG